MDKLEKAKEILQKYNQEHLLMCYESLDKEEQDILLEQILSINFEQMKDLYLSTQVEEKSKETKIEPISYIEKDKINELETEGYKNKGSLAIKEGKLAVITMAGGQGTRLGHTGPKGTFKLNVNPPKSLFEILCENLKDAKEKYGVAIPWYIMTSRENNEDTVKFFEENNYFNYPEDYVKFFVQGELPMLDKNGKILVDTKGFVKKAADGHGGIFEAIFRNKILDDMKEKNIEWVFIGPVDNPLAKMVDEIFIGIAEDKNVLEIGKSLVKVSPEEKVGVFCKKDGKPGVIEYTEISDEMASRRDENNNLAFGESHINCNMFNIKGIEKIGNDKLPYHVAVKKAKHLIEEQNKIKEIESECYKFESFIFDAFGKLEKMEILRVNREEEFAPVKGLTGADSAESATEMYLKNKK